MISYPALTSPEPRQTAITPLDQSQATIAQVHMLLAVSGDLVAQRAQVQACEATMTDLAETIQIMMRHIPGTTAEEKYLAILNLIPDLDEMARRCLWALLSPYTGHESECN